MVLAAVVFFATLVAIALLFYAKHVELRRESAFAPELRTRADSYALDLKELLIRSRFEAAKLPPLALMYARLLIHEGAMYFAAFSRAAERKAHELADLVSYKHRFERRETKSEFLKQVSEHKSENVADKNNLQF